MDLVCKYLTEWNTQLSDHDTTKNVIEITTYNKKIK